MPARTITVEQGGGCLATAGKGAIAAGVLGLGAVVQDLLSGGLGDPFWLAALALVGLASAAAGTVLVFGRAGVTISPDVNLVDRWWRLLGLVRSRPVALDGFTAVSLVRERVRGLPGGPSALYRVCLTGDAGTLELKSEGRYEDARALAQCVAAVTGWEVISR